MKLTSAVIRLNNLLKDKNRHNVHMYSLLDMRKPCIEVMEYVRQPIQDFLKTFCIKSTVFWVFEDLKFKISEGHDQFGSEPSEISNLRSSTTPETGAFTPP